MTKQEYAIAYTAIQKNLRLGVTDRMIHWAKLKDAYIASLEAENAALTAKDARERAKNVCKVCGEKMPPPWEYEEYAEHARNCLEKMIMGSTGARPSRTKAAGNPSGAGKKRDNVRDAAIMKEFDERKRQGEKAKDLHVELGKRFHMEPDSIRYLIYVHRKRVKNEN